MTAQAQGRIELPLGVALLFRVGTLAAMALMVWTTALVMLPDGLGQNQETVEALGLGGVIALAIMGAMYIAHALWLQQTINSMLGGILVAGLACGGLYIEASWQAEHIIQQQMKALKSSAATTRMIDDARTRRDRLDGVIASHESNIQMSEQTLDDLAEQRDRFQRKNWITNGVVPTEQKMAREREAIAAERKEIAGIVDRQGGIDSEISTLETTGAALIGGVAVADQRAKIEQRAWLRSTGYGVGYMVLELALLFFGPKSLIRMDQSWISARTVPGSVQNRPGSMPVALSGLRGRDAARQAIFDDLCAGRIQPGHDLSYSKSQIARLYQTHRSVASQALDDFCSAGRCSSVDSGRGTEYYAQAPQLAPGKTFDLFGDEPA